MAQTLYDLNIDKLRKGCEDKWFGSTSLEDGTSPWKIKIDEGEPLHFVQLLYILKERCWEHGKWVPFTKETMLEWIRADTEIYLENDRYFGEKFMEGFPLQVNRFLKTYCDRVGAY